MVPVPRPLVPVIRPLLTDSSQFHAKHCQIIETPTSNQRVNILTDVPEDIIPKDERKCAGLAQTFIFAVGAVVMLRRNIDTSAGLVNGARGIITAVDLQNPAEVSAIHVRFFDKRVSIPNSEKTSIAITPISAYFHGKKGSLLQRTQFPLTLSWACTIHKVQGLTLESAYVDIGPKVFANGMAYVALSRIVSLSGLHLIDFHPDSVKMQMPDVDLEMKRLRQLGLLFEEE